jgi:Amt family ammonium transporter
MNMKKKFFLLLGMIATLSALLLLPVYADETGVSVSTVEALSESLDGKLFGVWFLIGAALVFWMQAGFAMVEAGFTRAKNTGNILMKNLMDFCIGTVVFILIGFSFLLGEDVIGLIGKPGFDIFTAYADFDWSNFVFNLVFCATTATIVSGAMAERTKFLSYCVYSAVISAVIYPIEAHWIWGGGWLAQLGFHDFAGSCAIHMVGGISALIGAAILGPRLGKFKKKKDGTVEVHAFPGHNITFGALGVFILWFGWYGFNGAACTSMEQLASVFVTTTVAPAIATVVCMIFTWVKYGKPDVSMCLNASLAGLVAITASCDVTDVLGSILIGAVSGVLVVFGVWLLDHKLHIDDPVGAVAVHCFNGIWGTIAVGLFATETSPGYAMALEEGRIAGEGLFYGGGFYQLGLQLMGFAAVAGWTVVTMIGVFFAIRAIFGLRVSAEEEIKGLDITEHGLPSAYDGFVIAPEKIDYEDELLPLAEEKLPVTEALQESSLPDVEPAPADGHRLTKIQIICKEAKLEKLTDALIELGVTGMTVSHVMGCGCLPDSGRERNRCRQVYFVYRPYRRWKNLYLSGSQCSESSYRRRRIRCPSRCRINSLLSLSLQDFKAPIFSEREKSELSFFPFSPVVIFLFFLFFRKFSK